MDWNEQTAAWASSDDVHTSENPYCDDPSCWCHTDVEYHGTVEHPLYFDGEIEEAYAFFGISRS